MRAFRDVLMVREGGKGCFAVGLVLAKEFLVAEKFWLEWT